MARTPDEANVAGLEGGKPDEGGAGELEVGVIGGEDGDAYPGHHQSGHGGELVGFVHDVEGDAGLGRNVRQEGARTVPGRGGDEGLVAYLGDGDALSPGKPVIGGQAQGEWLAAQLQPRKFVRGGPWGGKDDVGFVGEEAFEELGAAALMEADVRVRVTGDEGADEAGRHPRAERMEEIEPD